MQCWPLLRQIDWFARPHSFEKAQNIRLFGQGVERNLDRTIDSLISKINRYPARFGNKINFSAFVIVARNKFSQTRCDPRQLR